MRLFGLIGYPLSHSFSAGYFAAKFEKEGIRGCRYDNYPIATITELPALFEKNPSLEGINITIPYKEQVLDYLDERNDIVAAIGACNCIRREHGQLKGYNTDVLGFEESLIEKLGQHHSQALILGTGGAAKAVEYVLHKRGIAFKLVSRKQRGDTISYADVTPDLLAEHTLIINTTPLGMYPNVEDMPALPYHALTSRHYLFDLVYNPAQTRFLSNGAQYGAVTKNGHDMLLIQAEESWRIWNSPMR
jgi:shikimate dehydrogenase